MVIDDNEDPDDRAEREKRERDILRMRPLALRAGKISTWSMFSGLSVLIVARVIFRIPELSWGVPCLAIVGVITMIITGPIAALVDMIYVIRLKLLGAKGLWWPVVLALPVAIVSTLLSLAMMGAIQ